MSALIAPRRLDAAKLRHQLPKNVRGLPSMSRKAGFGRRYRDNDNSAMIPKLWAMYTLAILQSNSVAMELFFRDFDPAVADYGDTVNTRKPAAFQAYNKSDTDQIAIQSASTTNIAVVLNQHPHVSFLIRDGEESKSIESLVELYLEPAVIALAEDTDARCLGMYPNFLGGSVGEQTTPKKGGGQAGLLGGLTNTNYQQLLTELGEKMDTNRCPVDGRTLVVGPTMKRLILQNQTLVQANTRGDAGTALRTANIGTIYGFDHFMCQNMAQVGTVDVASALFVTNGANKPGDTTIAVKTGTGVIATGSWLTILGKQYQVQTHHETLGNTDSVTIQPPLFDSTVDSTAITVFTSAWTVANAGGYAAGWNKAISISGGTTFPKVGELVTFPATDLNNTYVVVAVLAGADPITGTTNNIYLNKPLNFAVSNTDVINSGPSGNFGFAFHRNAVALVNRPLKLPRAGAGALAGAAVHNGISMRVTIAYSAKDQGHIVTIDFLMGLKVLDPNYGAVLNA